jgi:hypothetical protein
MATPDSGARRKAISQYHSLVQIPGLEGLLDVCRRHQVTMTCHGGAARRIAATIMASAIDVAAADEPRWSIFDCLAYNSDLDLWHSGEPDATRAILNGIYDAVPFAEHIRWELRSQAEQEEFDAAKTYAPIIPLCLISLGTHGGWSDPWNGLDDLAEGTARFIRNGFYRESPRFKRGVDIELLQTLLYYKVLVEIPQVEAPPESLDAARQVIVETRDDFPSLIRLQDSSYLRLRLRYFLSAIKGLGGAALAPEQDLFNTLSLDELEPILKGLGGESELRDLLFWSPRQEGHLAVTSHLGGDIYRLAPTHGDSWRTGDSALRALQQRISSLKVEAEGRAFLADDQQIVMASPALACAPGIAPSTQDNEFLHFAVHMPTPTARADSTDLGVVCIVRDARERTVAVGVPTVCLPSARDADTLTIRCNVGRILNTHPAEEGRNVQVFLSESRTRESRLVMR